MTLKSIHQNAQVTSSFGHKILCNGYVTDRQFVFIKPLIFNSFLCNGYVIEQWMKFIKTLIFNNNSCDRYETNQHFFYSKLIRKANERNRNDSTTSII